MKMIKLDYVLEYKTISSENLPTPRKLKDKSNYQTKKMLIYQQKITYLMFPKII